MLDCCFVQELTKCRHDGSVERWVSLVSASFEGSDVQELSETVMCRHVLTVQVPTHGRAKIA